MSLSVLDALSVLQTLKTTLDAGEHVAHHIIDSSALPTGATTEATLQLLLSALGGVSSSPSRDAFGRWRSSQPTSLFDSQFHYDGL